MGTPDFPHPVEAAADCPKNGAHEPFECPPDPERRPVNLELLGALMGAALEFPSGCLPCQAKHLDDLAADGPTTARLAEIALMMISEAFGGIPSNTARVSVDGGDAEFARMVAAGLEGQGAAVFELAEGMPPAERRRAASTALDTVVGFLMTSAMNELHQGPPFK